MAALRCDLARKLGAVVALVVLCCATASAQTIYEDVAAISAKYSGERGVMSMACDGGLKLRAVRMMLRKEFGEEFANNIEAFVIIAPKSASAECLDKIRADITAITAEMRQIDVSKQMKEGSEATGFVHLSAHGSQITDLLIVITAPHPSVIYLGGHFRKP